MFTGIIRAVGRIERIERHDGDLSLAVDGATIGAYAAGDSIAVNGVCLTLLACESGFAFDVSAETLSRTLISDYVPGQAVNLEPALTLATPLGGHLVTGHVDGIAEIVSTVPAARSTCFRFAAPRRFARFIAEKGSIALDGISLTVNSVYDIPDAVEFEVNIVPHTLAHTNLSSLDAGARVHLEIDPVARYLDRLITNGPNAHQTA